MSVIELQIDISDVSDIAAARNIVVSNAIAATAKEVLGAGGRVVLKRSYCNAPDDEIREYSVAETFEKDWIEWFGSQAT